MNFYAGLLFNQGYVADPALARSFGGAAEDAEGDPAATSAVPGGDAGTATAPAPGGRRHGRLRATLAMLLPGQAR
ncbi:hypothetical protein [Luteimonas kalidii]|uniref:Uncharacterized protein n=1 Tax=Luteimonas kalidii TaxID=3042025 RepID=A0ABT6JQG5_9GAMM|nr:hypothetical protein [Luteimonas kalidii]MDH5832366.1 hypothetical protein [Luteimonas kalidii]